MRCTCTADKGRYTRITCGNKYVIKYIACSYCNGPLGPVEKLGKLKKNKENNNA